jgi:spectinomycin phosphotransferase
MLTKPNLKDEEIVRCLDDAYGLGKQSVISFLPLGADLNTSVYRITTDSNVNYFLKLRSGEFCEASVSIPKYLADLGIKQIISPIETKTGKLWTNLESFTAILYNYVDGQNAVKTKLSERQWIEFGNTMKKSIALRFQII